MQKRIIIDGLSLLFREFHALMELKNRRNIGTGMAYGAVKTLLYLFVKYGWHSNQIILVWDCKPHWKYELFPGYKAKRKQLNLPQPMSVPVQIKICERLMTYLGISQARCEEQEADDVCATLASIFSRKGREVQIVSKDHDLQQCLGPNVSLLISEEGTEQLYTEKKFIDAHEVVPEDYWKVQTLGGCTTDKVPGMYGISEATAFEIVKMNAWSEICRAGDVCLKFPNKRSATAFEKGFPDWSENRETFEKLVRLQTNLKPKITKAEFNEENLRKLFLYLEFTKFLQPDNFNRIVEIFTKR